MTAFSYGHEAAVSSRRERPSWVAVLRHVDFVLVGATLALALIGVVMVFTATRNLLAQQGLSTHYYLERQAIWVVLGCVVMVVVASIDYRHFRDWGYVIYALVLASLVGVFVVGKAQVGVQRWYQLGPLQLQPSEFSALALIICGATYCSRRQGVLTLREVIGLVILGGVPMLLVYKQPDLGTAIVLAVTLAAMMVAAEVRLRYMALLFVAAVVVFVLALKLHLLHAYQLTRLTSFLHQNQNTQSANYELTMTRTAISSGGLQGMGIGHGLATNLALIPNQYTDFIFSAIGEQLGFIGSAVVIGLFGTIAFRMLRAAQIAKDAFGRLICVGAVAFLAFSVFENIGMNIGLMPITGIPLPFISYGGSASFAFFSLIGHVLNVQMRRLPRR
ncbi:MAG: FtsW/RodA/SpoVE family cell cycle protein [Acidimicrobiales bacterium]